MNHNPDHVKRVNEIVQFIKEHSAERLTLDELARSSNFSKYHFSRIFSSVAGTTPMAYVNRVRLALALQHLADPCCKQTVLEISQLCGFESVTAFNAAFKKQFHTTPREARVKLVIEQDRNFLQILRNMQKDLCSPPDYDGNGYQNHSQHQSRFLRRIWDMNVSLKELPDYEVAYVRRVGSYLETYKAWSVLGVWANEHQLTPDRHYFIGISLDDPAVVEEEECRYDACVTLPEGFAGSSRGRTQEQDQVESSIEFQTLPGGLYAVYSFYDTPDKLGIVYRSLFCEWLPGSNYEADERPCLEFCLNDPSNDPEGKCKVDLHIPVREV